MSERKVILKMVLSLDGFATSLDGTHEWMFEWFGDDSNERNLLSGGMNDGLRELPGGTPGAGPASLCRGRRMRDGAGVDVGGERFTDRPKSVCPVIAAFLRGYNDALPECERGQARTSALGRRPEADAA